MTHWLLARQMPDGRWLGNGLNRPPIEYSTISHTAIAVGGLISYPLPGRKNEMTESLQRARQWLLAAQPKSAEERGMRLMGLVWTDASESSVQAAIRDIRAQQDVSGGWSQFAARSRMPTQRDCLCLRSTSRACLSTDEAYRKGVAFLLGTQYQDGTWLVKTHAFPVQRYFESGFPFGRHQCISAAGTSLGGAGHRADFAGQITRVWDPASAGLVRPKANPTHGATMVNRRWSVLLVAVACVGASLAAQQPPGFVDPRPVLEAARKAIGADNLRCVTIAGTGYAGMVGQQRLHDKNVDWPRGEPLANYTRTMNWEAGTIKEEFDRKPGLNPASWKYGSGWLDGTPTQRNPHQIFMVNGSQAWHMDGAGGTAACVAAARRGAGAAGVVAESARLPQSGRDCRARTRRRPGGGSSVRWDATVRRRHRKR